MSRTLRRARRAFTLVELLIVVALVAIVLTLAAPSFRDMIEMQRLRSISAQLVTDVQFARSESVTRQQRVFFSFAPSTTVGMTCYIVHTCGISTACVCNCSLTAGSRCAGSRLDLRTVQVPTSLGVKVAWSAPVGGTAPGTLSFDPATGGITGFTFGSFSPSPMPVGDAWAETSLLRGGVTAPSLRTVIAPTGRPSVCSPAGRVSGVASC